MDSSECGNDHLASIKGRVRLDQLDDHYHLKALVLFSKDIYVALQRPYYKKNNVKIFSLTCGSFSDITSGVL
jgi:hypothetical protein